MLLFRLGNGLIERKASYCIRRDGSHRLLWLIFHYAQFLLTDLYKFSSS